MTPLSLQTRTGNVIDAPTRSDLRRVLAALAAHDPEHPDAWLSNADGWTVAVEEGGTVRLTDPDDRLVAARAGMDAQRDGYVIWLQFAAQGPALVARRLAGPEPWTAWERRAARLQVRLQDWLGRAADKPV